MKNIFKKFNLIEKFDSTFTKLKPTKIKPFETIVIVYAIIFSTFLFLSIPGLFNYEKYHQQIENKILSEFKLSLTSLNNVKYRFVPSPHLLIEEADLNLLPKNEESHLAKIKQLKIFISLFELYNSKNIEIKKIVIKNTNFNFKKKDISKLIKHLSQNITKPIQISNSNFFYINNKKEVTTISPVKKLNYLIDFKNREKKINISGKLFDINYNLTWNKNYNKPNESFTTVKFKNPNLQLVNTLNKLPKGSGYIGNSKITFLNENFKLKYSYNKNQIAISSDQFKNDNLKLNGEINLKPFFFNVDLILFNQNLNFLINNFLLNLYFIKDYIHENFNGNLKIYLKDIKNDLFKDGEVDIRFIDKEIKLKNSFLKLKKMGKIIFSDFNYIEKTSKLFFSSNFLFEVENQNEFYKKFAIPKRNRKKIDKIYFDFEKDIDEDSFYLSNIQINKKKQLTKKNFIDELEGSEEDIYEFTNIQQLRKILKEIFDLQSN